MTQDESTTPDLELVDEDVEGHGLKEVAAGLGTAALLASGAAGAAGAIGAHAGDPTTVKAGPVTVSVDSGAVREAAAGGAAQADATARSTVAAGSSAVSATGTAAMAAVGNTVTAVTSMPGPVDPVGATDKLVDHTVRQVRDERDATIAQGEDAAARGQATAAQAVSQARHGAADGVAQVKADVTQGQSQMEQTERAAMTQAVTALHASLGTAQSAASGARDLVVSLTQVSGGGSVDATHATGSVTVSDNGVVVGTASLSNGQATLTLTAPVVGGHTMTVTYHGDALHAPSSTTL